MMIAAWDCWDMNCNNNRPTIASNNNIESSNDLNFSLVQSPSSSPARHSPSQAPCNQGPSSRPQNVANYAPGMHSLDVSYSPQSYANVAHSSDVGYPISQGYPQSAVSHYNIGHSPNPSQLFENSRISKTEKYAQTTVYTIHDYFFLLHHIIIIY
jgi:hypothetical protein